jgi:hypothetical protein
LKVGSGLCTLHIAPIAPILNGDNRNGTELTWPEAITLVQNTPSFTFFITISVIAATAFLSISAVAFTDKLKIYRIKWKYYNHCAWRYDKDIITSVDFRA